MYACPICRRLDMHCTRCACSRALESAGSSTDTRIAMIPMTTSNSTSVKARRRVFLCFLGIGHSSSRIHAGRADHRNLVRYRQPQLAAGANRAQSQEVAASKHRARRAELLDVSKESVVPDVFVTRRARYEVHEARGHARFGPPIHESVIL